MEAALVAGMVYRLPEFHDSPGLAVSTVSWLGAYFLAGIAISMLIYRGFFHRLNRFPGPFQARLSNLYPTILSARNLHLYEEVEKLHGQYGDYVRLGEQDFS